MNRAHDIVQLDKEVLDMIDIPKWFSKKNSFLRPSVVGNPVTPAIYQWGCAGKSGKNGLPLRHPAT